MILTTRYKSKPLPGKAYPVSNTRLAEVLEGIPQPEIEVTYSTYEMTERRFQKTKMGKANHTFNDYSLRIITASHSRSGLSEKPQVDSSKLSPEDEWSLDIHCVTTSKLVALRACLEQEGYAKLKDWFIETSKYKGVIGYHTLQIGFDGKHLKFKHFSRF